MELTKEQIVGYVYIITNPFMKDGIIKIGYADDVERRLNEFNHETGSIPEFRIYATFPANERLIDKEIHSIIDLSNPSKRVNAGREFYYFQPEEAFEYLNKLAQFSSKMGSGTLYAGSEAAEAAVNKRIEETNEDTFRLNRQVLQQVLDVTEAPLQRVDKETGRFGLLSIRSKICKDLFVGLSVSRSQKKVRIQAFTDDGAVRERQATVDYFADLAAALPDANNNVTGSGKNLLVDYYINVNDPYNMSEAELTEIAEKYTKMVNAIK